MPFLPGSTLLRSAIWAFRTTIGTILVIWLPNTPASEGVLRRLYNPESLFASHGTCCAGLIVGEPAVVAEEGTSSLPPEGAFYGNGDELRTSGNRNVIPYFGVDPSQGLSRSEHPSKTMSDSSLRPSFMPIFRKQT